ncbi:YrhB domain-containing protein [Amycolatopsis sp. MJM2582]|uniref:YrhB domain-containing protein n=1 Tax=Amycolatopsis sp. MJM2582 TaxID=1427749 RepID=UPI0009DD3B30|nr:YrhB domain-containing protein [Amycolatopsis sp. MJM2582]
MVLQDAFEAAQRFLDERIRPKYATEIVIARCVENDDGWAFSCNSRAFLEDGEIMSSLVGNGPIIVPNSGTDPYVGGIFPRPKL